MNLNINKIQIQKGIFTASLEKSITVLLLPHAELVNSIDQELQENPLLEADLEQINALSSLSSMQGSVSSIEEDQEQEHPSSAMIMSLEDHLFQQLYWEVSDPIKRKIGEFIIGNLDKDGYLSLSSEEIAQSLGLLDVLIVKDVLRIIQNFDPIGVATKDLKESLIIQLLNRQSSYRDLGIRIVNEGYLDDLGHKRYIALAKKLSVSMDEVTATAHLIASLEPKPARNYCPIEPTTYIEPDVRVYKNDAGEYVVEPSRNRIPTLRINQTYRNLLNQPNITEKEKAFIREKLNNALTFIKNIQQRGSTLVAITKFILQHQKRFFDGEESTMMPMILKDVSLHLDRCESTISRAISNKYIDTPQGLLPFKFFFSHKVACQNNENVSAHTIKEELAQLIIEENKESPLSDHDIQVYFDAKGLHLARRTVTKYRQILHIPSSHLRK